MKYFIIFSLLVIYMAGTCLRPVVAQSSDSTGGGHGSASNGGSSYSGGTNENQASGTIAGVGRVLGTMGMSSRSSGESGTSLHNNAEGGGSGIANTD